MAFPLTNQIQFTQGFETPNQLSTQQNLINVLLQRPDFSDTLYMMFPWYSLNAMTASISFQMMKPEYTYTNKYQWFLLDRSDNPLTFVSTNGGTGAGGAYFNIVCEENYGQPNMVFRLDGSNGDSLELMINSRPTQVGANWQYSVQIFGTNQAAFVAPPAGTKLGSVIGRFGEGSPRGFGNVQYPSGLLNYTTITRLSRSFTGSAQSSTTWLNMAGQKLWVADNANGFASAFAGKDGGFLYQKEKNFWVANTSVDNNGKSWNIDPSTGNPIYAGEGFISAVANAMTVTYTAASFNSQFIDTQLAIFVQNTGLAYAKIDIHTGQGGYLLWQESMKQIINYSLRLNTEGNDPNREVWVGEMLAHYKINNAEVYVHLNPVLSDQNLFPSMNQSTGLPQQSYNFYLIENSMEDGMPTIQKIVKSANNMSRALLINQVDGVTSKQVGVANEFDGNTFTFLSEDMLIVRKPNRIAKWINIG